MPLIQWKALTHGGRVTHICVGNLTIIGPDNGLSPGRRQAIIWTNAGILLIGPLGTNFSEIVIENRTFSFKKMRFKLSSGKWRPFCLGLNVLTTVIPSGLDIKLYPICLGHVDVVHKCLRLCDCVPDGASDSTGWACAYFSSSIHQRYRAQYIYWLGTWKFCRQGSDGQGRGEKILIWEVPQTIEEKRGQGWGDKYCAGVGGLNPGGSRGSRAHPTPPLYDSPTL